MVASGLGMLLVFLETSLLLNRVSELLPIHYSLFKKIRATILGYPYLYYNTFYLFIHQSTTIRYHKYPSTSPNLKPSLWISNNLDFPKKKKKWNMKIMMSWLDYLWMKNPNKSKQWMQLGNEWKWQMKVTIYTTLWGREVKKSNHSFVVQHARSPSSDQNQKIH